MPPLTVPRRLPAVALLVGLLTLLAAAAPLSARASDYVHECRTADGNFVISDGALTTSEDYAAGRGRSINYQVLDEIVLEASEGYCVARTAEGSRRYGHEYRQYILRIAFRQEQGERVEATALCELSADGLPAAYTCDRRYTTLDWRVRVPQPRPKASGDAATTSSSSAVSYWDHNGSTMRLVSEGRTRAFVYERPRKGIFAVGARAGTVLFTGTRDGRAYEGTAFVFTRRCGPRAFKVAGEVSPDDQRVVLRGEAPRLGDDCRQTGTRPEVLEFRLLPDRQ